jgi:hypothetical protein
MNVKQLKELIKDLPDEMDIGGSGHFGEFLECVEVSVSDVYISDGSREIKKILCVKIEDAGEDPD